MRDIAKQLSSELQNVSDDQLNQVAMIAQQKQAGINGRLQALALASGALALLGLAALIVAQDTIATTINNLFQSFSIAVGVENDGSFNPSGAVVVIVGLVLLVATGIRYALQTYRELRLLEIINVACSLRLSEPPIPSNTMHPQPVMSPTTQLPTTKGEPLLLIAFLVGLALVQRILGRH